MEKIKQLFKRAFITAGMVFIYGIIVRSKEVWLGMFSGALISILTLYMLCLDVKNVVASSQGGYKRGLKGYLQRYLVYVIYLGIIGFFGSKGYYNPLPMLICSGLGLLNIKGNILFMALSDKILKYRDKNL